METERGGSGVNSAGCSIFSALSFKATAWLHIRFDDDPAPGQPSLEQIALRVLAMPPLVFGDGEGKKVSAFPLCGILKTVNTGVTVLVLVLTTECLYPSGKYLSCELHWTCANIKAISPLEASGQCTLILRGSSYL